MTRQSGFTLIELMIVVVIIGILAAIALPKFTLASATAKEREADTMLKQYYTMQQTYYAQYGVYASTVGTLEAVGWVQPSAASLSYYAPPAVAATPALTMSKPAGMAGHCDRQIDIHGTISSVAGTCP